MNEPGNSEWFVSNYAGRSLHKRLNDSRAGFVKSATIRPGDLFSMCGSQENRLETAAFPRSLREASLTKGLPCGKAGHFLRGRKAERADAGGR
jgi:hypothetical protein